MSNGDRPSERDWVETPGILGGGAEWLRGEGPSSEVVLSSRVRLARNLAGFPFVARADRTEREHVLEAVRPVVDGLTPGVARSSGSGGPGGSGDHMSWIALHDSEPPERQLLVERHLISKQHADGTSAGDGAAGPGVRSCSGLSSPRAVAVSLPTERLSIMVNEEDHLRVQVLRTGLDLGGALAAIDAVDDALEATLDFAYSPRFGYLTCCPTNVGTGARLSVMLHLPGLRLTGEIDKVKRAADSMSLAIRGFYGEGSEASGDFYQLSNQTTLGRSEKVLLHEMEHEIVPQVIDYERLARERLLKHSRLMIEDRCARALGLLRHARLLSAEEAMKALSQVRLGVVSGLIRDVDLRRVHELMLLTQPAHLQRLAGRPLDQQERRSARADLARERLTAAERGDSGPADAGG